MEKVHELAESIGKTLAKAEQLGAEGNVDESLKLMEEVEQLKKKKYEAEVSMHKYKLQRISQKVLTMI